MKEEQNKFWNVTFFPVFNSRLLHNFHAVNPILPALETPSEALTDVENGTSCHPSRREILLPLTLAVGAVAVC